MYNVPMETQCTLRVRTYECDSYGHVNNANYLNYLEFARYEYLRDIGFNFLKSIQDGYGLYIARIEVDYKMPAFTDDELLIKTKPVKMGAVSGTLAQQIWRENDLLIEAKVSWAFVDSNGKPTKLPAEYNLPGLQP